MVDSHAILSLLSLQLRLELTIFAFSRSSIQSRATIISGNLATVSEHMKRHADLFNATVAYPLPNFPGRTQEELLGQLLRKKLEPKVEDWVQQGRELAVSTGQITHEM